MRTSLTRWLGDCGTGDCGTIVAMTVAMTGASMQVVIDTDPGIDDAMAILFLHAHPEVRIAAMTTVFGNASIDVTTRNACYLAQRFGIDAPVIAGAADPIASERPAAPSYVHGRNGLGDVRIPDRLERAPEPGAAHERIVDMIRAAPHQLCLLTLGPLTNLALALRLDPGIAELVPRVIVMGGAFGGGRRRGNVSPVAEANMRNDPHAADAVLAAPWPVTVVGLDVTMNCLLTSDSARSLAATGGAAGQFLWDISRDYEAMYGRFDGVEGCFLHDVAAAVCVVRPELFATVSGAMRVVTEGIAIGQTIQRPPGQLFPPGAWDDVPAQRACDGVNADAVVDTYTQTLIAAARRGSATGAA